MVRIQCEKPTGVTVDQVSTIVEDWVSTHDEVLTNERHSISLVTPEGSGPDYLTGSFRFSMEADTKTGLLDDAESAIQSAVAWYQIRYHVCDHDENSRQGCSWDDVREYGTVPEYV